VYQPLVGAPLFQPPYQNLAECLQAPSNLKSSSANPSKENSKEFDKILLIFQFFAEYQYYLSGGYCLSQFEETQSNCIEMISYRDSAPCTVYNDPNCASVGNF
jgi:hypothetical protein